MIKLRKPTAHLDPDLIQSILHTKWLGRNIEVYQSLDSTNLLALKKALIFPNGTVILAEEQSAGRGRLGRSWLSPYGKGIYMSIILKPEFVSENLHQFTLLGAIAVCEILKKDYNLKVSIRWPNDVIANKGKLAGILAESNNNSSLVLGIGINVSQEEKELPQGASSLFLETAFIENRNFLIAKLLKKIEIFYANWQRQGLEFIEKTWNCYNQNHRLFKIITRNYTIHANIIGLWKDGIIVRSEDNSFSKIAFPEVLEVR